MQVALANIIDVILSGTKSLGVLRGETSSRNLGALSVLGGKRLLQNQETI